MNKAILSLICVCLWTNFSLADDAAAPKAAAPPVTAAAAAPKGKEFSGEAGVIQKRMVELFEDSKNVNAKGAAGKEARGKIDKSLDWDRVAQDCLGKTQWKKQSEKNRHQFSTLLKEVVTKTAYSRLSSFWTGTTYQFDTIDLKGNDSHVVSRFLVNGDSFTLEYYLWRKDGKWQIYDIAYDGLRYSKAINEQLVAFLREKGFPSMLDKLRKRLEELDDAQKSDKT